jgi:uncharacterized damage-inducible protein DinB
VTLRWVERSFDFSFPVERIDTILERLRGTPARLEEKLSGFDRATLIRRDGDSWSIQEHAGHLLDLDELHLGRLDDYESGAVVLRPADTENRKTREADHNARPLEEILAKFREERARFVVRLEAWDDERLGTTALHPRLNQPMRVVDMAYFVAEHDDHHLARMTGLARAWPQGSSNGISAPARTP